MEDSIIGAMHEARHGLWARTNIYRQGNTLHAVTYLVVAGEPTVFRASVDLSRIERAVERYHDRLHGKRAPEVGKFGDRFKKFAKKIGRSKLIRKIGKGMKKVIRSKITGGVLAAVSFVPGVAAVSGPALAAYSAANVALNRASGAKNAAKSIKNLGKKAARYSKAKRRVTMQAKNLVKTVKRGQHVLSALRKGGYVKKTATGYKADLRKLRKLSPSVLAKLKKSQATTASAKAAIARYKNIRKSAPVRRRPPTLRSKADEWKRLAMLKRKNPAAFAKLQKMSAARAKLKTDKAAYAKLAALKSNPKAIAELKAIGAASRDQQAKLAALVARSRNPSDKAKQTEAIKALMVLRLVAKNRAKLKAIASASRGGAPGLLIDNRGRIIRGKFTQRASRSGEVNELLYTGAGASERGHFSRISGEVGACIQMPVRVAGNALDEDYFVPNVVGCDDNPACNC